jgi:homoserine O-acetyltransferase
LGSIKASTVVTGIGSDLLFPVQEQKQMANHIPGAIYEDINSIYGHDGFLLEYEQTEKIVKKHFKL